MPRHRQSLQLAWLWKKAGIRTLAMLTLLTGVTGGLYLAEDKANKEAASAEALFAAEQAQQDLTRASVTAWSKRNAQEREEEARIAAEQARLAAEEAARKKAAEAASRKTRPGVTVKIPASCNEYSGNRAVGCALLLEAGFTLSDMANCLEPLWAKESGWNERSTNRSSGAYGIPQALPANKMAKYGDDYRTNPATQVKWGLSYITGRYGTPCGAWSFFKKNGWY